MLRNIPLAAALATTLGLASLAHAQGGGLGPVPPGGPAPKPVKLTTKDVERLIEVLPKVAKEGAKFIARQTPGAPQDPKAGESEEMKKIDSILSGQGLTMMDFAM